MPPLSMHELRQRAYREAVEILREALIRTHDLSLKEDDEISRIVNEELSCALERARVNEEALEQMTQNRPVKWIVQWFARDSVLLAIRSFDSRKEASSFIADLRERKITAFGPLKAVGEALEKRQ